MKQPPRPPAKLQQLALPLAVLGLATWNALPTLVEAWQCDLYARGAPLAFAIWLAPQAWLVGNGRHSPLRPGLAWMVVSLILGVVGSMSGLRVLHHLAFAAAVPGVLGLRAAGLLVLAAAPAWLPATGWFVSHLKAGGLAGWERPAYAALAAVFLLVFTRRSANALHANPSHS